MNSICVRSHQQNTMTCFTKHLLIQNLEKRLNSLTTTILYLSIIRWKQKAKTLLDGNTLKKVLTNGRSESSKPKNDYLGSREGSLFSCSLLNVFIILAFSVSEHVIIIIDRKSVV